MSPLAAIGAFVVLGILAVVLPLAYLSWALAWGDQRTKGLSYYGLLEADRVRFRKRLQGHARRLAPVVRLLARASPFRMESAAFITRGVAGPKGTCSEESFSNGIDYSARPEDVFVVTQMKCGTTWMQNVVYETLMRGRGDLVDTGTALYAVSPWLESEKSVGIADAPTVGQEPARRVVKTHLPAALCPRSAEARFIYVSRHPGSCFASCVDFLRENLGPFDPGLAAMADWYRSDEQMWWGTWPEHVAHWWSRAQEDENVLWVRFEDMKDDLAGVVRRVADHLEIPDLTDAEVDEICRKCGFDYMSRHPLTFEMHPPHLLASDARLFVRGSADRFRDIPPELNEEIVDWAAKRLGALGTPVEATAL